jgi:hypothetical protein
MYSKSARIFVRGRWVDEVGLEPDDVVDRVDDLPDVVRP